MQCEEFEDRLNAVLDERRRPEWDAELRLHCDSCAECRQVAASYDVLLDGFYALAAPEAPADMALCVLAELGPRPTPARRWTAAAAALAMAACVLVVVAPLVRGPSSAQKPAAMQTSEAVAAAPHRGSAATTGHGAQATLEQFPLMPEWLVDAEATGSDPYAGLAKETGQGLATVILYVPGVGGSKGIIDVEADGGADEPAWAVQMSEGLKPITESVTETVNLLLRIVPMAQFASRG
jgi:hypothetical protein